MSIIHIVSIDRGTRQQSINRFEAQSVEQIHWRYLEVYHMGSSVRPSVHLWLCPNARKIQGPGHSAPGGTSSRRTLVSQSS